MKESFDKLFSDRQTKLEQEATAAAAVASRRTAFRERAITVLDKEIVPILKIAAADLQARGEQAEVLVRTQDHSLPSATLKLKLRDKPNAGKYFSPSTMSFNADESVDGFRLRFELWVDSGKRDWIPGVAKDRKIESTDKAWVEGLVISFVSEVVQGT